MVGGTFRFSAVVGFGGSAVLSWSVSPL